MVISAAAVGPRTVARQNQLLGELQAIRSMYPALQPGQSLVRWGTHCLRTRAPTTTISYWRTLLSLVPREIAQDPIVARYRKGLETLYGHAPWYPTPPPMTHADLMRILTFAPQRWVRVRTDMEWGCLARDSDLTYVHVEEAIIMDDDKVQVNFQFMKNDQRGVHRVRKEYRPMRMEDLKEYLREREGCEALFPQAYDEYLDAVKRYAGPQYGTRSLRKGAAEAVCKVATAAEIQVGLAHRNPEQQRNYYKGIPSDQREATAKMAAALTTTASISTYTRTSADRSTMSPQIPVADSQTIVPVKATKRVTKKQKQTAEEQMKRAMEVAEELRQQQRATMAELEELRRQQMMVAMAAALPRDPECE